MFSVFLDKKGLVNMQLSLKRPKCTECTKMSAVILKPDSRLIES